jgi:Uma2 family endonuclease
MNKILTVPLPGTQPDPRYPDSDGRFMGDTDFHNVAMILLREALEDHFADHPDVYVATNLVFYWEEGNPKKRRDPDGLVARGVAGKHKRRSYRLWEEKKVPCTLFEIASRRTWRIDLNEKPNLYAEIGVKEYFIFDPEYKYLKPVLQGFRRVKGKAVPLKPAGDGSLVSKELGLTLIPEGEMLRFIDLTTGKPLLTRVERAEQEQREKEQEHRRAEELAERAKHERQRADELAVEVARLRRLLEQRTQ